MRMFYVHNGGPEPLEVLGQGDPVCGRIRRLDAWICGQNLISARVSAEDVAMDDITERN